MLGQSKKARARKSESVPTRMQKLHFIKKVEHVASLTYFKQIKRHQPLEVRPRPVHGAPHFGAQSSECHAHKLVMWPKLQRQSLWESKGHESKCPSQHNPHSITHGA